MAGRPLSPITQKLLAMSIGGVWLVPKAIVRSTLGSYVYKANGHVGRKEFRTVKQHGGRIAVLREKDHGKNT